MTDLFTMEFLQALISIIIIDLVLAGDNAIVIAMAARKLPKNQQKKVIIGGTAGAHCNSGGGYTGSRMAP